MDSESDVYWWFGDLLRFHPGVIYVADWAFDIKNQSANLESDWS